jgi:hypothetical protein
MEDETEVGYHLGGSSYCFRYVTLRITYEKRLTPSTAIPLCDRVRTNLHRSPSRRNWRTRSNHAISPHSMFIRRYTPIPSKCPNAPKSSTHVRKSTATTTTNETTTQSTGLQTSTKCRWNETSSNGFRSSPRWTRWTTTRWNATTSTSNSICPKSSHFHIG